MKNVLLYLGDECFSKVRTGVGKYHDNILQSLNCEYTLAVSSHLNVTNRYQNCKILRVSAMKRRYISFFKWFLPFECFFKGYDIVFTDSFSFFSFDATKKFYMIVHDCMSFTEPENYTIKQKLFSKLCSMTYKRCDLIIAVSQTTKQTVHTLFKIPYNKICVISNITDFYIKNFSSNFYLFIGDMRKTKNLDLMILGFKTYLDRYNCNERLIIAGSKKNEFENLKKIVSINKLEERIFFPGYVDEDNKNELFSKAKGLIFLSDNEGFGIPLLEAAVNKIPILCSDIPIFREVLSEDYAVFVDNKDIQSIADGFLTLSKKIIDENKVKDLREKYSMDVFKIKINKILSL